MKTFLPPLALASTILLFPGIAGGSSDPPPELDAPVPRVAATDRAALHKLVGQRAVVFGRIERTNDWDGGINFLNFEGGAFTSVCFRRNYENFEAGRPAELYRDKWVELIGIVELHKGKPQIELVRPTQMLRVEDEAPDDAKAKPSAPPGEAGSGGGKTPAKAGEPDAEATTTDPEPGGAGSDEPAGKPEPETEDGDGGGRVDPDDYFED